MSTRAAMVEGEGYGTGGKTNTYPPSILQTERTDRTTGRCRNVRTEGQAQPRVPSIVTGKKMDKGTKTESIGCNTGDIDMETNGEKLHKGKHMIDKGTGTQAGGEEGQGQQGGEGWTTQTNKGKGLL